MHTGLDAGAFINGIDLTHRLSLYGRVLDHVGYSLRVRKLVFDGLRALHRNQHARIRKAILHRKVDTVLLNIGNDYRLGIGGLADGRSEKTDSTSAENQHRGAFGQVGPVAGVHGNGERLEHGAQVEGQGWGEPGRVSIQVSPSCVS